MCGGLRFQVKPYARALIVVLACAQPVIAQTVYKSTMPDGKVVYGERPAPGAARVDKMEPPPPKTGVTGLTAEEKALAEQQSRQRAATAASAGASQRNVDDARRQLQQAQAAFEGGKEPLPGERLGLAGGGSRLTEAYAARQKALEDAVRAAQKRLEEAEQAAR